MTIDHTPYHVMINDDGEVLMLLRFRTDAEGLHGEAYHPGKGWVRSHYAFDVWRNGQDYDVIDEAEAERLIEKMERDEA